MCAYILATFSRVISSFRTNRQSTCVNRMNCQLFAFDRREMKELPRLSMMHFLPSDNLSIKWIMKFEWHFYQMQKL